MQFKKRREMKHTKIEIIPMIDTMFFLLVFFILTSLNLVKLTVLNVNLPEASEQNIPQVKQPVDLSIDIREDSSVYINNTLVNDLGQIGEELLRQAGANVDTEGTTVTINASPRVKHGLVVQVMDEARSAKFSRFAIATQE